MTKLLLRVLSMLRWPTAVFAVALLGLTLLSSFEYCRLYANGWSTGVLLQFTNGAISAELFCYLEETIASPTWSVEVEPVSKLEPERRSPGICSGWWCWEHHGSRLSKGLGLYGWLAFPAWCIFVPLGVLSALGFRAKRHLVIPSGACPNCGHPMAGAAVCPECGSAAPSSSVGAHQP